MEFNRVLKGVHGVDSILMMERESDECNSDGVEGCIQSKKWMCLI
jgi:hypothetical protein